MSFKRILGILLALLLLAAVLPLTVFAEQDMEAASIPEWKTWSQGDSRWGRTRLGRSWSTVAGEGCLVTAMTKLLIQSGLKDPETFTVTDFMQWMNANGSFTPTGGMYLEKPAQYSGLDFQGFLLGNGVFSAKKWNDTLVEYAAKGFHMVLQVKNGGHWVAIDNELTLATGEVHILDSLPGGINAGITLGSRYSTFRSMVGYTGGVAYPGLPLPTKGTCGQGMSWQFEETSGLLTISGQGPMRDYRTGDIVPWLPYAERISRVQICEGVTKIGSYAFGAPTRYPSLTRIDLADSVDQIGAHAFEAVTALSQITVPKNLVAIGERAFAGAVTLAQLDFPAGLSSIGAGAFADCTALETLRFEGEAPTFGDDCFKGTAADVWYPAGDLTWTEESLLDHGGALTWAVSVPAAPEVTASGNASDGLPVLSWTAVSNAESYQIWHAFQKNGKYTLLDTVSENGYMHSSPSPGATCYYKVRAVLHDGTMTDYSEPVCRVRDLPRPTAAAERLPSGMVRVGWNKIDGAQGYEVWRSASGKAGSFAYVATVEETSLTLEADDPRGDCYYKVRAIHTKAEASSAFSGAVSTLVVG